MHISDVVLFLTLNIYVLKIKRKWLNIDSKNLYLIIIDSKNIVKKSNISKIFVKNRF